jgi:multicomponent K+:H+ antiporter subunit A
LPVATQIAAWSIAVPFAGAALIALLRAARWRAPGVPIAVLSGVATATLVALLWLAPPAPSAWRIDWVPAAGIGIGLRADALGVLFAALVAGVGLLTIVYSAAYVPRSTEGRGRSSDPATFFTYLLLFQGSMLGLVLSENLVQLYVFWELLDLAAFLLIGLRWRSDRARTSAVTVLLFTTVGGLALLAGTVLLGTAAGTYWIPDLIAQREVLRASPLFVPALLLVVTGAAAKSAQFPFHVWLPRAMAAPTPINAFDDAVLVPAAGVFLLVLLHPVFAAEPLWTGALVAVGFASILVAGTLAAAARDLKVLLAYSTVSQYGFAYVLLGYGSEVGVAAALFAVFHHALLKSGLFFVTGTVGYASGRWEVGPPGMALTRLPLLWAAGCVLAASLAGLPPLGGFGSKEYFLEQTLETGSPVLVVAAVLGSALTVVYLLRWLTGAFSASAADPARWRRPPAMLVLVPGILAALTLLLGLFPGWAADALVNPAAATAAPGAPGVDPRLRLDAVLLLSAGALAGGALGFVFLRTRADALRRWSAAAAGAERIYGVTAQAFAGAGGWTLRLQNGVLLRYTSVTLLTLVILAAYAVVAGPGAARAPLPAVEFAGVQWSMALLLVLVCAGTLMTFVVREHLQMVLVLGAVGFMIAGVFALALAPNLGLLQVHVETLVTVLLVLPLAAIPRKVRRRLFLGVPERVTPLRLAIALLAGAGSSWVSWLAIEHLPRDPIAPWFTENAPALVGASDVVAAVLIQFRALDTLGEILVFATATLGVLALGRVIRGQAR